MKAVVYERYGPPDVLHVKEVKKPTPMDNEVLIKVRAAEVTKADCELRNFKFPVKWTWLPMRIVLGIFRPKRQILGGYFAGEIESIGKNVAKFKKGDQIFGTTKLRFGAYGEYMCLPESYTLVPKPNNLTFEEAATVPLGGLNALHFLRKANIQKGEKVLINGAGGSIGIFGVQIAKAMGAEVTAVDRGLKEEMLRSIGADHFIDYTKENFSKNNHFYDVIFNMVAKCSYSECIKVLNLNGRYLMANPSLSAMIRSVLTSKFTDKKSIFVFAGERVNELLELKEMIEGGKIKSVIDKIYSYDQTVEAHRRVETEQRIGIVVVTAESQILTSGSS